MMIPDTFLLIDQSSDETEKIGHTPTLREFILLNRMETARNHAILNELKEDPSVEPHIRLAVITTQYHYAYGKPKTNVGVQVERTNSGVVILPSNGREVDPAMLPDNMPPGTIDEAGNHVPDPDDDL
jgi:hypothetical protein